MKVTYITMNLGEAFFLLRKRSGMTLKDVEEITGVSASTLSRIERNQTDPTLETLNNLAALYGCHLKIDLKAKEGSE